MAGNAPRTFSEQEHEAILTETVRREVASAVEEHNKTISELESKVDVLEAEKATELEAKETAERELAAYKEEVTKAAEIEGRKESRIAAVKEISLLPESYFTPERAAKWAEKSDEDFASLLDDLADQTIARLPEDKVREVAALDGESKLKRVADEVASMRADEKTITPSKLRETAAFSGGVTPTSREQDGAKSAAGAWLNRRRAG